MNDVYISKNNGQTLKKKNNGVGNQFYQIIIHIKNLSLLNQYGTGAWKDRMLNYASNQRNEN